MKVTKIRLKEDTVKNSDGTWSNKGEEGSHGKFKTKKKADAQRKAMFANGYENESLDEEVIPNKEINYIGFFVNNNDINRVLRSIGARSLEKRIPVPHVTTEYKPKEIETSLFGKTIDIVINGYGKNDTNEGFRVELRTNDPDLQNQIDNIAEEGSIPHITTSISADGKAVNTRYLDFKDIKPITIKGTFGGFTKNKGIITSLKESLFLEEQGDSAKLDQRSKKYIADPTANVINSLLGLQKRQKKSFFGANGSGGSGGNGSWNEQTVVTLGDRNFELMCKKYGFLQKDFNIHNVLRREAKKGIKLGDLAWRIKNEGSTRKDVKWIEKAIMKWVSKNESLTEAWFTPLSEMSSFTGWMDDDKLIDEEERFNSKVERALKTKREDIQVLIDEDFQYDPRTYSIEELTPVQEIKTKNIHANKFIVNGIEFIFEDAGSSSSPRLYFKSEEDGEAYTNYIDHFYDEEM